VYAWGTPCAYKWICKSCKDKQKTNLEKAIMNPKGKATFLQCEPSCAVTLQIPPQISPEVAGALAVSLELFSLTLELKLDTLPPREQFLALLRFSPEGTGRSRRRNAANLFVDSFGRVLAKPTALAPPQDAESERVIAKKWWHVVTVVVDAPRGKVAVYIDGELASADAYSAAPFEVDDITLREKVVIFGGGNEAEARGGNVSRLLLHTRALSAAGVRHVYQSVYSKNSRNMKATSMLQRIARGRLARVQAARARRDLYNERLIAQGEELHRSTLLLLVEEQGLTFLITELPGDSSDFQNNGGRVAFDSSGKLDAVAAAVALHEPLSRRIVDGKIVGGTLHGNVFDKRLCFVVHSPKYVEPCHELAKLLGMEKITFLSTAEVAFNVCGVETYSGVVCILESTRIYLSAYRKGCYAGVLSEDGPPASTALLSLLSGPARVACARASVCVRTCVRTCVCACVRASVRACVRAYTCHAPI
jgi:hypothetical protein